MQDGLLDVNQSLFLELFGPESPPPSPTTAPSTAFATVDGSIADSKSFESSSCDDDEESAANHNRGQPVATSVPGLVMWKHALSPAECRDVLDSIKHIGWFDPAAGINQAMRFGKLPTFLDTIGCLGRELIDEALSTRVPLFDQMIGNHYYPGQGLTAHVDLVNRFADGIVIASLCGSCIMEFSPVCDADTVHPCASSSIVEVFLESGDIVGLSGAARWSWKHGIPDRMVDEWQGQHYPRTERISITLRRMLPTTDSALCMEMKTRDS
ncbi:hypothetical protein BASA50_001231 [Batrachochytrium salamandrivorans]|uniref:Fe2OG dioxygenase domain-containing protein n=1 Tax=Batrachochytrium salamandrivorans TaxID=1357716 RepID=A0ABQ8ERZ9_9FUNG|nr:hypothetical protein BASA62_009785 [Batrachochytrium salamandrivorans]KAH6583932.1 hypothetical protein BASA60_001157 [Batrachochytrium salamandrivorans]KAH6584483.1 hypothetical protein BASA61_007440 [Batrachochytrium salamandrivorans]KAH6585623.1 hypothetical protein BASA50_001231 [Batrachochytrium salamandrivorans]KAH9252877.1 hypothetical protein BASA81_009180 [Batrachochytrium salamandrivorans]